MPRYARAARFDQDTKRETCADGTRTEILCTVHRWFKGGPPATEGAVPTGGNPQGQIFWLDGEAGTGKSTIAQTVAYHYHETDQLAASFFCSRDDAERSNVGLVFPTIAYQLCSFSQDFRDRVSEAMRKDPDLQSALPSMQLQKLIIGPLEAVMREDNQAFPPCVIVIDALDECKEENTTSTILFALSKLASRLFPLKIFITSRPVTKVVQGFRSTDLMKDTNALVLHTIPFDISQKDIRVYLQGRLLRTAQTFELESLPLDKALDSLFEQSRGLFIFAATVANFIEDRNVSSPQEQLQIMLSSSYIASPETSPHRHLDGLYLKVLGEAFPKISDDQRVRLGTVLGTIVLLFDPLKPQHLEALLGLKGGTVRSALCHLHSIIIVPAEEGGPVRLIHPSFHDFLINIERCDDVNFAIDARPQHTSLAECCLRVLQGLSRDICKIGDPSQYNREITDLPDRISTHIPAYMQYACRHWASHLSSGEIDDGMLNLLSFFCSTQLLNC